MISDAAFMHVSYKETSKLMCAYSPSNTIYPIGAIHSFKHIKLAQI